MSKRKLAPTDDAAGTKSKSSTKRGRGRPPKQQPQPQHQIERIDLSEQNDFFAEGERSSNSSSSTSSSSLVGNDGGSGGGGRLQLFGDSNSNSSYSSSTSSSSLVDNGSGGGLQVSSSNDESHASYVKKMQIQNQNKVKGQYYLDDDLLELGIILDLQDDNKENGSCSSSSSLDDSTAASPFIIVDGVFLHKISEVIRSMWKLGKAEIDKTKKLTLIGNFGGGSPETVVRSALYIAQALLERDDEKLKEIEQDAHVNVNVGGGIGGGLYSFDLWLKIGEFAHKYIDGSILEIGKKFQVVVMDYFTTKFSQKQDNKNNSNSNNNNNNNNNNNQFNLTREQVCQVASSQLYPITIEMVRIFIKSNELFHVQVKKEFRGTLDSQQKQLYELMENFDDRVEKETWTKDFLRLIELDKLPQKWEQVIERYKNHPLPSGQTLKEFILNTYKKYFFLMLKFPNPNNKLSEIPRFHWDYCCWRQVLELITGLMYTIVRTEDSVKLCSLVEK